MANKTLARAAPHMTACSLDLRATSRTDRPIRSERLIVRFQWESTRNDEYCPCEQGNFRLEGTPERTLVLSGQGSTICAGARKSRFLDMAAEIAESALSDAAGAGTFCVA